ncbi:MAG TPA: response regulator, partial [Thermoanaerobaculia bacterium]|nr:response regulator [Thermoanaerobaculia bacterium]
EIERDGERRTVIMALTASVFEHERAEIFASGSDDFILKPFRVEMILDKLAEHLSIRYRYEASAETPAHATREGLDVADGVRRASGNAELYWKLVDRFANESTATIARLRQLLDEHAIAEALDVLHTLRGTAATLGAHRVAQAAAALERDASASLDELSDALAEVRRSAEPVNAVASIESNGNTLEIANRLHALLATNDLAALECAAELRASLHPTLAPLGDELQSAVDRLDFEKASALLREISRGGLQPPEPPS